MQFAETTGRSRVPEHHRSKTGNLLRMAVALTMALGVGMAQRGGQQAPPPRSTPATIRASIDISRTGEPINPRSEEHTSELQSLRHLVCRLLLEKKREGGVLTGDPGWFMDGRIAFVNLIVC